jgi:lipopolysaccharide transport system ATP-binding protein
MSSDVLVRIDHVSKKFCRSLKRSLWYGVTDTAADMVGRRSSDQLRTDEFWAVDNVSLELARGECLGLIGRNGAGKTTLLKMLNGLIKPDIGRIELSGRVGALISLGAGFNPILTGRENVYVNGSVLGLTKREIDGKFHEIVEFAEISDFIDTPVQSYSAGMQVRLGFAVATAIKPDVLLLDEVLAVGDVAFRAKCYERLAQIRNSAAFVLVSHDTDQIARVCSQVLVLHAGQVRYLGDVGEGIRTYQELVRQYMSTTPHEQTAAGTVASIVSCNETIADGGTLNISLSIKTSEAVAIADVRVVLWGDDGLPALDSYSRTQGSSFGLQPGCHVLKLVVGPLRLKRGGYAISIAVLDRSNNRHLYWGDRIRTVDVDGPAAAAVSYTPLLMCAAIRSASDEVPPSSVASSTRE